MRPTIRIRLAYLSPKTSSRFFGQPAPSQQLCQPTVVRRRSVVSRPIANLGITLHGTGLLRPTVIDNLAGIELTDALCAYVRRINLNPNDAPYKWALGKISTRLWHAMFSSSAPEAMPLEGTKEASRSRWPMPSAPRVSLCLDISHSIAIRIAPSDNVYFYWARRSIGYVTKLAPAMADPGHPARQPRSLRLKLG